MKPILKITFTLLCFCFFIGCTKKGTTSNSPDDSLSAKIGSTTFSAKGTNVHALIGANPADTSKTELSITAENGSTTLTVAVYNFKELPDTFSFNTGAALGGYNSGTGGDDPIVTGSLIISTDTPTKIEGTFAGTTQGGLSITTGAFTLNR